MDKFAKDVLKEHYSISGKLKRLNAYASVNFKVTSAKGTFVLKIYINSKQPQLVRAENQVLLTLANDDPTLNLPKPVPTQQGDLEVEIKKGRKRYVIRLLTYIEGDFVAESKLTKATLKSIGIYLAKLNTNLMRLQNPVVQSRKYVWNIQQLELSTEYLPLISPASRRNQVRYFIQQYRENVGHKTHLLRHSIIHNDAHEWNLLLRKGKTHSVIDFGDMVHAPLVQEIAVATTYLMMDQDDPWHVASTLIYHYHNNLKLKREEIESIYYFIAARVSVSLCMSAYSRSVDPDNEYATISEKPALRLLDQLLQTNPISATNKLLSACGFKTIRASSKRRLTQVRHRFISKALSLSYNSPIEMGSAAFQYMYDTAGNTYLDCANNIFHVGHCHPIVIRAAQRQQAKLNTNTRYLYDQLNSYAENLLSKFDARLSKVFFVNSGSAATDLALRLSRNYTGTNRTLVMDHGYHGNTAAAIEVSAYKFNGKGGTGKPDHVVIAPLAGEGDHRHMLSTLQQEIESDETIGTFIAESIVGCGGQVPVEPNYIQGLYQMIRLQGGVCIADEVQTGFGRVGSHFWAFETQGLSPDLVVLGKPMGNGHPLAAVVTTPEIAEAFENGMEFFSSFGGNPVSCVIGQAVLDVIEQEALQTSALTTGSYLIEALNNMQKSHAAISDVRGHGLFLGIELTTNDKPATSLTRTVVDQLKQEGILLGIDGPHNNVIKFKPPMCFDKQNADLLVDQLSKALKTHKH